MLPYIYEPKYLRYESFNIPSFVQHLDLNLDKATIASFGEEWLKFNQFDNSDIEAIGQDYFDLIDVSMANNKTIALDAGCGSGRWAKYLSPRVKFIEAIDPSLAVITASKLLGSHSNIRVSQASISNIPFADNSFDFIFSLGVLHHLPDTQLGLANCVQKLRPGGWILIYLYYNLDNRNFLYRFLFKVVNIVRLGISRLPIRIKHIVCDFIAIGVYLPMTILAQFLSNISPSLADRLPLAYYRKTSLKIMRNDALDRFGTPIEQRFSKLEIETMLKKLHLINIKFSNNKPFWHVIAQKA